jgi:hypothetical protein
MHPRAHAIAVLSTLLAGACADNVVLLQTEPLVVASEPPVVLLDLVDDQVWVTPGVVTGTAIDAEQAPSTLPLSLGSSIDGTVWRGNPDGDGEWSWSGELTPGTHSLGIQAIDREGNVVVDAVRLQVRTNASPTCRILEPRDGARVPVRAPILFEARAADADGDAMIILWRSSLDGPLFEGSRFERNLLSAGVHRLTIQVGDGYGPPCTDEVTVLAE